MKRALVTGAGSRLGRAMAVYLGGRGYDVAVHYSSSADDAAETVRLVEDAGGRARALQADLLQDSQTEALFDRSRQALGGDITCLVNNASIFEHDTIDTANRVLWDRHMQTNLRAPFLLTQAVAAQDLPERKDDAGEPLSTGVVVNMVDQRVRKLTPEFMTYTLAKMGLWAFTQSAAQALAPTIRVNAIGPGPTLQGGRQTREHFELQRQNTILQRGSNLQDITAALGFILDAPALTGQLLCIDGGQHLGWKTPDILGLE